jgi:hypothetical protein
MRVLFFLALCLMAVLAAKYKGGADLPPDSDLRIGVTVSVTPLTHVALICALL